MIKPLEGFVSAEEYHQNYLEKNPNGYCPDHSTGVVFNNGAEVTVADVEASNGIVHVVDKVVTLPTVVDHAVNNTNYSNLVAALGAADGDLVNVLSGTGPFTVLAPDDTAFATFLDGAALADVDTAVLSQILLNHDH